MRLLQNIAKNRLAWFMLLLIGSVALAGCPELGDYDRGFEDGFAEDDEYWRGYYDSWDTRDGGEIYYSGHEIPYIDDNSYEAGYWDGVWVAYNDGYFVAYDYAFTIGFSDGYDATYQPNWRSFIANDEHIEWLDGGFTDGYNDGFSEGRIFGADDWEVGRDFDWMDAMLDYRAGVDVLLDPYGVELGTGVYGPVYLYEWGTDPWELIYGKSEQASQDRGIQNKPAIRHTDAKTVTINGIDYRSMLQDVRNDLKVRYDKAPRGEAELNLQSTWLDRIESYLSVYAKDAKENRAPTRSSMSRN